MRITSRTPPPSQCQKDYLITKGYRLVANTRCDPDHRQSINRYSRRNCPTSIISSSKTKIALAVVLVLLFVFVGAALYLRKTNEYFRAKTDHLWGKIRSCFQSASDGAAGYSSISGRGAVEPHDLDDDDNEKLLGDGDQIAHFNPSNKQEEKEDFI